MNVHQGVQKRHIHSKSHEKWFHQKEHKRRIHKFKRVPGKSEEIPTLSQSWKSPWRQQLCSGEGRGSTCSPGAPAGQGSLSEKFGSIYWRPINRGISPSAGFLQPLLTPDWHKYFGRLKAHFFLVENCSLKTRNSVKPDFILWGGHWPRESDSASELRLRAHALYGWLLGIFPSHICPQLY